MITRNGNDISLDCTWNTGVNRTAITLTMGAYLYDMSADDIPSAYTPGDNESNYRKGVLMNYIAFRVLRCDGRHGREDEGVEWTDMTFSRAGETGYANLSHKFSDLHVRTFPAGDALPLLFTSYNQGDRPFGYWWEASEPGGSDGVFTEGCDPSVMSCAVNFGKYFTAQSWNSQQLREDTYGAFDDPDGREASHVYVDAPLFNSVSIDYDFADTTAAPHTYYIEFMFPDLDMNDTPVWTHIEYYVHSWDGEVMAHSEYVPGTCRVEMDGVSEGTLTAAVAPASVLDSYILSVTAHRRFSERNAKIKFDLRKYYKDSGYVITPSAEPGGSISPSERQVVARGGDCSFVITPDAGWHISAVMVDEGTSYERDVRYELVSGAYTFTNVTDDHTIHAYFEEGEQIYHNIYSHADSLGTITPEGNTTVIDGGGQSYLIEPSQGQSIVSIVVDGAEILPEPVSGPYTYVFEDVHEDHEIYASFKPNTYYVTVSANPLEGGQVDCLGGYSYEYGRTATVSATANPGWRFVSWTEDGEIISLEAEFSFNVFRNRNLVANFESVIPSYEIETSANPSSGGTTTGDGTYLSGTTVTISASAAEGCTFVNWMEDGNVVSTSPQFTITVEGDRYFTANFAASQYTIISSTDGYGTITPAGVTYAPAGTTPSFTAEASSPDMGVHAVIVDKNTPGETDVTSELTGGTYTFPPVHADHTIYASFRKSQFMVKAAVSPEGSGYAGGGGIYSYGASVTLTAEAESGWTFVNWTENGIEVSTSPQLTITVERDRYLTANFVQSVPSAHTITMETDGNGEINGDSGLHSIVVAHGEQAVLTIVPLEGLYIMSVTVDSADATSSVLNGTYTFQSVTSDHSVYATFGKDGAISVSAESVPIPAGIINDSYETGMFSGYYSYGDLCELTAVPSNPAYYRFQCWKEDGTVVSTSPTYSFNVFGSRAFEAHFDILQTVAVNASASPSAGGGVSGGGVFNYGDRVTLTATANTGWHFDHWSENGVTVQGAGSTYMFTAESDRNLVANFAVDTHTVSASASPSGGGSVSGSGTYDYGQQATLYATSAQNYRFDNWTENGTVISTSQQISFTVTGDRDLVANFTRLYGVLVELEPPTAGNKVNGHNTTFTVIVPAGDTVTLTAYPFEGGGYSFGEWIENGATLSTANPLDVTVNSDLTIIAHFNYK